MANWAKTTAQGRHFPIITVTPFTGEHDLVPAIDADGEPVVYAVPRTVGPSGLWGCATCEQFHPVEAGFCPFAHGVDSEDVVIGPYETDEGTLAFKVRQAAERGEDG